MAGRFLQAFKPIAKALPVVHAPERRVRFSEKLFWTLLALIIYLIMGTIPLYGVVAGEQWQLQYMRIIFASQRGRLTELGIGPIVTAGLILQLLVGANMIECDMTNPEDRALFTSASKAFSMIFTGIQASAYIIGGVYGRLDPLTSIIVFLQLIAAGIIIILLDEMVQKGWGLGSGISLFILGGVAQQVAWWCLFPGPSGDGKPFGFFPALIHVALTGEDPVSIVVRGALPSLVGFLATIAIFLITIYLQGVRVEIPIAHAMYKGFRGRYPINLLYVSNLPVIFASALFANIYFFSQLFWVNFNQGNRNPWINLLGMYRSNPDTNQLEPIGGLVYYVISPRGPMDVAADPIRALGYAVILIAFCAIFSVIWLEVGGLGPSTVAKQLVDSGMQIPGYRRSAKPIEMLLKRYIPAVTVLGGIIVGLIAASADFLGAFGSGTGILLSVGILYQYYQILLREQAAEMYPALRRFIGG